MVRKFGQDRKLSSFDEAVTTRPLRPRGEEPSAGPSHRTCTMIRLRSVEMDTTSIARRFVQWIRLHVQPVAYATHERPHAVGG